MFPGDGGELQLNLEIIMATNNFLLFTLERKSCVVRGDYENNEVLK